jgi:hypothetical protein
LIEKGATEFVVSVRSTGEQASEWQRVGIIVAAGDAASSAILMNKRGILEHAKTSFPSLRIAPGLEVGVGADADADVVLVEGRSTAKVLCAFSPDAVVTDGPFYVSRRGDGRAAPVDTTTKLPNAFKPRGKGEGKTPES